MSVVLQMNQLKETGSTAGKQWRRTSRTRGREGEEVVDRGGQEQGARTRTGEGTVRGARA
eukprot:765700-Hanusia_phi.AAC.13